MTFINEDFYPCLCGHDGVLHCKQFSNIGEHTNIFVGYLHCEWNDYHYGAAQYGMQNLNLKDDCICQKFRPDNLRYLERLS